MKAFEIVAKILTTLAAVAGAIYLLATYGEKIVEWSKKVLSSCPCKAQPAEEAPAAPAAEEAPAEEAAPAAGEAPAEPVEEPAPEVVAAPSEPVAEDADFAE